MGEFSNDYMKVTESQNVESKVPTPLSEDGIKKSNKCGGFTIFDFTIDFLIDVLSWVVDFFWILLFLGAIIFVIFLSV